MNINTFYKAPKKVSPIRPQQCLQLPRPFRRSEFIIVEIKHAMQCQISHNKCIIRRTVPNNSTNSIIQRMKERKRTTSIPYQSYWQFESSSRERLETIVVDWNQMHIHQDQQYRYNSLKDMLQSHDIENHLKQTVRFTLFVKQWDRITAISS